MDNTHPTIISYQREAARTANPHKNALVNYAMGVAGEVGEVIDGLKKQIFHGHKTVRHDLSKELGDVLWYVTNIASLKHIDLGDLIHNSTRCTSFSEYQQRIAHLRVYDDDALLDHSLGLSTEAGKISDIIQLHSIEQQPINTNHLSRVLLHVIWEICNIATLADIDMNEVAQQNLDKLQKRYPTGFSSRDSIERKDTINE